MLTKIPLLFVPKFRLFLQSAPPDLGVPPVVVPPATPPVAPPVATDYGDAWYKTFKDEPTKAWLHSYKGAYPDPEAVAAKAMNLEKFVGVEKSGRGVIIPKEDDKPEVWQAFWKKVGNVPEKADGYKLPASLKPEMVAELEKDPMIGKFREHALKHAVPPAHFQAMLEWYANETAGMREQGIANIERDSSADHLKLKTEWKQDYDKNIELGRRAAHQFVPAADAKERSELIHKIESVLGTERTFKMFQAIGAGLGEHAFVQGAGDGGGGLTPEGARVKIDELKKDKEWTAKMINGNVEHKAEWDRLHRIAFGTQ